MTGPFSPELPSEADNGRVIQPPYFFGDYSEQAVSDLQLADAFASEGWISHCHAYAEAIGLTGGISVQLRRQLRSRLPECVANLRSKPQLAPHLRMPYEQIRRSLDSDNARRVSVLDLGGGFGDNFHELNNQLGDALAAKIDYTVVDNVESCELGERFFANRRVRPKFSSGRASGTFDIVLLIGTLQYVLKWRDFLASTLEHCRRFLYVARTPLVSSHPTFFSLQSICPALGAESLRQVGLSPVVIISKADLTSYMSECKWTLARDEHAADYSTNFSRLPSSPRTVTYSNLLWTPSSTL